MLSSFRLIFNGGATVLGTAIFVLVVLVILVVLLAAALAVVAGVVVLIVFLVKKGKKKEDAPKEVEATAEEVTETTEE